MPYQTTQGNTPVEVHSKFRFVFRIHVLTNRLDSSQPRQGPCLPNTLLCYNISAKD